MCFVARQRHPQSPRSDWPRPASSCLSLSLLTPFDNQPAATVPPIDDQNHPSLHPTRVRPPLLPLPTSPPLPSPLPAVRRSRAAPQPRKWKVGHLFPCSIEPNLIYLLHVFYIRDDSINLLIRRRPRLIWLEPMRLIRLNLISLGLSSNCLGNMFEKHLINFMVLLCQEIV